MWCFSPRFRRSFFYRQVTLMEKGQALGELVVWICGIPENERDWDS